VKIEGRPRALVVADAPVAKLIQLALNHGAYSVEIAPTAGSAKRLLTQWRPHLLIVDIDLSAGGASALIGERLARGRVPTIALTVRGDLKTKLAVFDLGADDFLTLPFSPEELVARALALMRRSYGDSIPLVPIVSAGELQIDMLNQRVRVGDRRVALTTVEQAILYLLASHAGETLDRETILDVVWGSDYVAESNVVDRHIRNLRLKLKENWRRPRYIATVAKRGYRFISTAPESR
jgi:two-component system alkaline phosphatase synthesis response regulator PhoP